MINEAVWLLEEGIVEQAMDIDLVWPNGFGFRRYRGGLLYYADDCGLTQIVSTRERLVGCLGRARDVDLLAARSVSDKGAQTS